MGLGAGCSLILLTTAPNIQALQLTDRSIQISTATPSAIAGHAFSFTYSSTSSVGSVVFEYCENSPLLSDPCTVPAGLDVTAASLGGQTGNTGFSIDAGNTTANRLVLTRPAAAALAVPSSYSFSNITNPSAAGQTEFVRITTRASTDGTGAITDDGGVAFATISPFNISTNVPPFIRLCVGISVAADCSSATGNSIDLGSLESNQTDSARSQFAAATNSVTGYGVFVLGTTMTSGNNSISALSSPSPSQTGVSQFGINLRANTNPLVGEEPSGAGTATVTSDYSGMNLFKLVDGDALTSAPTPTDYNRMTVSYLVNVSSTQAPGVYTTTLTYLATADF